VQLEILIHADGRISDVVVVGSSSHQALDDAAVEAVRSLPRQPFPAGVKPRVLRARLPVVFELR
jgi:TonB family protein